MENNNLSMFYVGCDTNSYHDTDFPVDLKLSIGMYFKLHMEYLCNCALSGSFKTVTGSVDTCELEITVMLNDQITKFITEWNTSSYVYEHIDTVTTNLVVFTSDDNLRITTIGLTHISPDYNQFYRSDGSGKTCFDDCDMHEPFTLKFKGRYVLESNNLDAIADKFVTFTKELENSMPDAERVQEDASSFPYETPGKGKSVEELMHDWAASVTDDTTDPPQTIGVDPDNTDFSNTQNFNPGIGDDLSEPHVEEKILSKQVLRDPNMNGWNGFDEAQD